MRDESLSYLLGIWAIIYNAVRNHLCINSTICMAVVDSPLRSPPTLDTCTQEQC